MKQIYEDKSAVFLGERVKGKYYTFFLNKSQLNLFKGYVENTLIMNSDFLKTIQDKGQPFHYCKVGTLTL